MERAVEQAEILRVFDRGPVVEALGRAGPRRGAGVLRTVLAEMDEPAPTRNTFEEDFFALCRAASLPQPAVNEWLATGAGEMQVDFLWRSERLIVETDGRETHGTPQAFERDRRRDQELALDGYTVLRFTHRQLGDEPRRVAETVRALLGR